MLEMLREAVLEAPGAYVAIGGFIIGTFFGFIVYRTNFCAMGSISDIMSFGDHRRFRSWLVAGMVAMIGAQGLNWAGVIDLPKAMYLQANLFWLGNVVGGVMFGFGMVLAGGCVSRNIARVGGGDIGSLITLGVTGVFAYITIGGLFGPLRAALSQATAINLADRGLETQGVGEIVASVLGTDAAVTTLVVFALFVTAVAVYCFKDKSFRSSPAHVIAGVGIGLCVVAGWALTGLAGDEMADHPVPLASLTYVRPSGDTLEYLMRFTALSAPGFGVVTVFGAFFGALVAAVSVGRFHLTAYADIHATLRNLTGAALMGTGGVLALGCTVGQAITGLSTLAIGSFITFGCIVVGGVAGVKYVERLILAQA